MRTQLVALYLHKYGLADISLHATAKDAYNSAVSYLQIGYEDDPDYADPPEDLDDVIEWCNDRADEQGVDLYCTSVDVPEAEKE